MRQKHKKKHGQYGAPVAAGPRHERVASGPSRGADLVADGAEELEPQADSAPMPAWLIVLMIVLVYWAMLHLDRYGGGFNELVYGPYQSYAQLADLQPKSGSEMLIARGAALFAINCQFCHGANGAGTPGQFPPLAGSEWVLGAPARLIRIPNNGLQGPIIIKNQPWNASMAAMGGSLSDEELAAILSYVRNSWGNKASLIAPEQVKAVRAEIGARPRDGSAPWSADELLKIPETP